MPNLLTFNCISSFRRLLKQVDGPSLTRLTNQSVKKRRWTVSKLLNRVDSLWTKFYINSLESVCYLSCYTDQASSVQSVVICWASRASRRQAADFPRNNHRRNSAFDGMRRDRLMSDHFQCCDIGATPLMNDTRILVLTYRSGGPIFGLSHACQ